MPRSRPPVGAGRERAALRRSGGGGGGGGRAGLDPGAVLVVGDQADGQDGEARSDVEGGQAAVGVVEVQREGGGEEQGGGQVVAGRVHRERQDLDDAERV